MSGQTLKSERIQLQLELVPSQESELQSMARRAMNALVGVTIVLTFEAPAPAVVTKGGGAANSNQEAGPAFGALRLVPSPSTEGKEADHADA